MKRTFTKYPSSYVKASLNRNGFTLMEEYAYQTINHELDFHDGKWDYYKITPKDIVDDVVKRFQVSPEFAWAVINERLNEQ